MKKYVCMAYNENGKLVYFDNSYSLEDVRGFVYQARRMCRGRNRKPLGHITINDATYYF